MLIHPGVLTRRLVLTLDTILDRLVSLGVSLSGTAGSLSLSGAEEDSGGEEVEEEVAGDPVLGGREENPESAAAGDPGPRLRRCSLLLEPSRTRNRK